MKIEVSIAVRIGLGARECGEHIHSASEGLGNSGQLSQLRYVGVMQFEMQSKRVVLLKCGRRKHGSGVEVGRGVAVNERAIARGEMGVGELEGGGECVPVNHPRRACFAHREGRVEVIDF